MKLVEKNDLLNSNQSDVKEKKKKKVKTERKDDEDINGKIKTTEEHKNVNMLKRSLPFGDDKGIKKKKRNKSDSLTSNVNVGECIKEVTDKESKKHEGRIGTDDREDNGKNEENLEDENDTNEQIEEENGKSFRMSISSPNALDALRRFIRICNENKERDLAAEYLDAGGNILEVLTLLNTGDKTNIGTAITVFSAVRILLIKILAYYPQYQISAEGACRHLINCHLSLVHSMLSPESNAKHKRAVLQLLAAIVSLGGNFPRELLAHLSLPVEVIKSVARHTKPTDSQNTRNCFIHFILAFLIEGNAAIIKALLSKRDLLPSIFSDMIYDSKDIVALVITTLKTYILKNPKISKTMKLHIFSTPVIQNFMCLYNWKGPENWRQSKIQSSIMSPQYLEEKEVVTGIVHDFLITLLTSHKYGVIFHDHSLGTSYVKHNSLASTVLQSLDRPWEHAKPCDLVLKIMSACPDLIKSQFTLLESHIEPKVSIKWMAAIKFARKLIESVDVETCLKASSLELNVFQLANATVFLTLPETIIKRAIVPSLTHSNIIVRHEAILTLTTMAEQIRKYLSIAKVIYNEDSDFYTYQSCILESIIKNVPNLNMVLEVWNCAFIESPTEDNSVNNESISKVEKYEHLQSILNLLHIYNEICPKLLYTLFDLQPNAFLDVLNKLDDANVVELNAIKAKAIQFLVLLNPTEFSPQKKIFSDVLSFLICLLDEEVSSISSCVKESIKILLCATGMFEGCNDQLDVWINGFVNLNDKEEVTNWFVNVIKKTARNIEKYANEIIKMEEAINEGVTYAGRLEDTFNELLDKDCIYENLENNDLRMQRFTTILPVLCCMLHKVKKDSHPGVLSYTSYILVHTLYHQVAPECLIHLTKEIPQLPVQKYLLSWLEDSFSLEINEILPALKFMSKLNSVLVCDNKIQMSDIFNGTNIITFKYNDENITISHSLSAYEIMCFCKMTVFYLTQFIKRGILKKAQMYNYRLLLVSILHLAKDNSDNSTLVEECAKSIFTHPVMLYYFSPFHQKSKDFIKNMVTFTIVDMCNVIIHMCKKNNARNLFSHFKNKLFIQLHKMIDKHKRSDKIINVEKIISLMELLQLTSQNIVQLLKKLMELESTMFISKDEANLSMYGHMVPKLLEMTCKYDIKSERNAFFELDAEFVKCLCSHLFILKSKRTIDFEKWETTLHNYISMFPFNITGITVDIFSSLLSTQITDTTVRLISFLISKNIKFMPVFVEYMIKSEKLKNNNIVFPIIARNLNFKWNQDFLKTLKQHYKAEILSYLCNPKERKPWIEENVAAISYLIKNTFNSKICSETCNSILQIGDQLDMVSVPYVQILQDVYNKCATSEANSDILLMNLIQVLLHIITLTLKKESKNVQKLHVLCQGLNDTVKKLKEKKGEFVFETLSNSYSWPQFVRFSLKLGLKELKENEQSVPILKTLSTLCDIAYKNDSNDEHASYLFDMATSHSEFINIMLESSETKRDLVELLWILMQKNKTVMSSSHVSVYLAAYNATLSEADQYILLILQYYESNSVSIYEYRPYLWGNAAAIHYSVKGERDTSLWRQPSTTQVLNLFEEDIVNNTIKNYPMDRALKNKEFCKINNIYDPAFYLPLLCSLLSENNNVSCQRVVQSGALALAFAACSSNHSDVRMVAYTIIARYYAHLEASSSKAKLLWMRLIDALRYGITSLQLELHNVRLNCLVSTFLARTSLIATQPYHSLYSPLQTFLMAKPALDINTIPELLQLFHSSDVDHQIHRHWILETIRDGMKTESELDVAFKCVLFKMLLDFYTCTLSDSKTKKLILEVIDATLKIPKAAILLIEGYGLLPWLFEVTRNLSSHETQHIELTVNINDKVLNTLLNIKGDTENYKLILLNSILSLKSYLFKNIAIGTFTLHVNTLQRLLLSKQMTMIVSKEYITEILEFSKEFLGSMDECEDMLRFGCEYVTKVDSSENDSEAERARNCLRTMVWTWCTHQIR
ncbi:nucleolar pre-ribosomal-associated protein 1 [Calliopsis andreniformis]|uniref:nucleolar pre-ribosomal-associated protein 1 n=1 Tax=Calliopsis andreniformis TaxID=337506 RepID=UPI003FCD8936